MELQGSQSIHLENSFPGQSAPDSCILSMATYDMRKIYDSISFNPPCNTRLDMLDAVYQALAPKRKEPEQKKHPKSPKGRQTAPGWEC